MASHDLAGFIGEVTGESHLRVEEDLGGGFVRLRVSEAERRQAQQDIRCVEDVVLELLRNARDAGAGFICLATGREGETRSIICIDDGAGIPHGMWGRVFEPRVTSKLDSFRQDQWGVHGRGMALYSIACNTLSHEVAASGAGLGCAMRVSADVRLLPEKADQSTQPRLVADDAGRTVVRGPRNINRIVAEFTLAEKGGVPVFAGSVNEVLATLVDLGRRTMPLVQRTLATDVQEVPVCLRPALAATPEELAEIAAGLGLDTSARSARRILDGQVAPLRPALEAIRGIGGQEAAAAPPMRDSGAEGFTRTVRISQDDRDALAQRVRGAYRDTAAAYYLDPDVLPEIRVQRGGISVFIPFAEAPGEPRP